MTDESLDAMFERGQHKLDPALLTRVSTLVREATPVRPVAPAWVLASGLFLLCIGMALLGAFLLGFRSLSPSEIGMIFPVLGVLTILAAVLSVREMTPGSRSMRPTALLLVVILAFLAVDAALFHDYQMGRFLVLGVPCFTAGIVIAIPTGAASWMILRKGFAVNPVAAGLAAGTLAGLAGLLMLELHCPNTLAMHVMVWHTAVIPMSALLGGLVASIPSLSGSARYWLES